MEALRKQMVPMCMTPFSQDPGLSTIVFLQFYSKGPGRRAEVYSTMISVLFVLKVPGFYSIPRDGVACFVRSHIKAALALQAEQVAVRSRTTIQVLLLRRGRPAALRLQVERHHRASA